MKKDVIEKLSTLIISAFGLVAALAWNNAMQSIFKNIFGTPDKISAMLSYAVVVTIIAVITTVWIGRIKEKTKH